MSKAKHTPGPWFATEYGDIRDMAGETFVGVSLRETAIERIANASLIAAAPDLLEALKDIAGNGDGTGRNPQLMVDLAIRALDNAEGR